MPMTPEAAKSYKPRRTPGSIEDVVRSEDKEKMLKDVAEAKMLREAAKAYDAASGMKKGGKVSASKRADGIAQRGKTRGTMIMCKGGKM